MKKMFLVVAATVIAVVSFGQVKFGAQVIGNAGTVSTKSTGLEDFKKNIQVGVGAGLVADIGFSEHFAVRPSLNYLQKKGGVEYQTQDFPGKTFTVNSTLHYLELPLQFIYKLPMKNMTAYIGAGPSFGYGMSGKLKAKGWVYADGEGDQPGEVIEVDASIDAFKKEDKGGAELKRFDISANAVAGIQLKNGLYANAGYMAGLSNLAKEDKYKTRGIQLTIGYLLPAKL